ncbi:hypothetical protein L1D14_04300 [Vibrio tubiashii]|uniref:hypothetical protein n=1 Tax=Vibrio tubiashii TaxID=29498 RepID=UPI001EFD3496|nr:hypothetical protein [Vibrio tubiashii]MCG9575453.1 hypothetical protein [Vibrio tubiashii]
MNKMFLNLVTLVLISISVVGCADTEPTDLVPVKTEETLPPIESVVLQRDGTERALNRNLASKVIFVDENVAMYISLSAGGKLENGSSICGISITTSLGGSRYVTDWYESDSYPSDFRTCVGEERLVEFTANVYRRFVLPRLKNPKFS